MSTEFSSRTVLHRKKKQQPQSGSGALVVAEKEDLVENKVPLNEYCSVNNTDE